MSYTMIGDAPQVAQAFLQSQLTHIETEVYRIEYPEIRYHALVPVDTTANEWIPSVTYYSLDMTGQAKWINGRAQDIPNANVIRAKFETPVSMGGIGYEYTLEELSQAQLLGRNLTADKGSAARLASEQFIDVVALFGDTAKGYAGLVNNSAVTTATAAATGTGSTTTFSTKTPDQILADINGGQTAVWSGSNTVELADTLLLPLAGFSYFNSTRIGSNSDMTILRYVRENNIYTARTGRPLLIEFVRGLDTAGAGGTARAVFYRRDPMVVKMHIPMPFQFLRQPWQVAPMTWHVPGIMRLGGVDIRRPSAFRYIDGV